MKKSYRMIVSMMSSIMALMLAAPSTLLAHEHFTFEEVADGLNHPWGLAFLPSGDALITERNGTLRLLTSDGLVDQPVEGLPDFIATGQAGMMGISIDPDFSENSKVYVCLNVAGEGGWSSEVHVGEFDGSRLNNVEPVFVALPKYETRHHFGCRITFDRANDMFISLGDRGNYKEESQNTDNHTGTVVRLNHDGSIPDDNPFAEGGAPEVYTYGHRNIQGMAVHPETGEMWTHEHGPRGGDEVNILTKGDNYGWPTITYGINYNGTIITDKKAMDGMRQPVKYWDPSYAPSGMMFYSGDMFEDWQGDLFIGSLKFRYLKHLTIEDDQITSETNLFEDKGFRVRDVVQGPEGAIYLVVDSNDGKIIRVSKG
ncbi:MAG: PQQ-dependent sugar dehydrogenase [Pseudomonadota bacterium]